MKLTDEDLREYIAAYKRAFNEDITLDQARSQASLLLHLLLQLNRPLPSETRISHDPKSS